MTETGTQTWHELAERVSDMENRIDEALSAYYRGATLDGVIDRIRQAQESKVTGAESRIFGAGWEPVGNDPAAHYQGHHYRGVKMDPYRIADIYQIPAGPRWQILKKTLRGTSKGQSEQEVINEIRSALDRWQEMVEEDHG